MLPLAQLVRTLVHLASRTQLRILVVEAAARLSLLGAQTVRKEISMYRAYHARKAASSLASPSALQPKQLQLLQPRRSDILFKGITGTTNPSTSDGRFPRWVALVGVTAAQLAVACRWPLEDSEEDEMIDSEADCDKEEQLGRLVKRTERLEDLLASREPILQPLDLAMEFWHDYAEEMQP